MGEYSLMWSSQVQWLKNGFRLQPHELSLFHMILWQIICNKAVTPMQWTSSAYDMEIDITVPIKRAAKSTPAWLRNQY